MAGGVYVILFIIVALFGVATLLTCIPSRYTGGMAYSILLLSLTLVGGSVLPWGQTPTVLFGGALLQDHLVFLTWLIVGLGGASDSSCDSKRLHG